MKSASTSFIALCLVVTGCSTSSSPQAWREESTFRQRLAPHVYVAPESGSSTAAFQPAPDTGVRVREKVLTYQQGRTLSADRNVMHEAHPVYRVVQSGQWNLTGKQTTDPSENLTANPITSEEIEAEKQHQSEISQRMESMESEINQWHRELKDLLEEQKSKLRPSSEPPLPTHDAHDTQHDAR